MVYRLYLRKAAQKENRLATLCVYIVMFCGVRVGVHISCLGPRSQSVKPEHWFFPTPWKLQSVLISRWLEAAFSQILTSHTWKNFAIAYFS